MKSVTLGVRIISVTLPRVALLLGGLVVAGCATPLPPTPPITPDRSIVAIALTVRYPVKLGPAPKARIVHFIRVDDEEGHLFADATILSNYVDDNYAYLLNARPGRYAAVAVDTAGGSALLTYLPKEVIERTQISVGPSEVVFMGEFVIDAAIGLDGADPAQLHYHSILQSGQEHGGGAWQAVLLGRPLSAAYRGSLHSLDEGAEAGAEARSRFIAAAREKLGGAGWSNALWERSPVGAGAPNIEREE